MSRVLMFQIHLATASLYPLKPQEINPPGLSIHHSPNQLLTCGQGSSSSRDPLSIPNVGCTKLRFGRSVAKGERTSSPCVASALRVLGDWRASQQVSPHTSKWT
jgi:hypothetical protein